MAVLEGNPAPEFELLDENEQPVRLSDFRGKQVVLYFYPKDDTPGCTKEACGFRDDYAVYRENGIIILGVSPDSPRSHAKFKAKYQLPFSLLSDPNKEVIQAFGVWGKKKFMGREYEGVLRTTFLIDGDGRIVKVFENVKPEGHSAEILSAFQNLN